MPSIFGADWLLRLNNADLTTAPASDAQALAKTATDVALTPKNLAALGSTATFAGLAELATNAEALAGSDTSRALTAANLAHVLSAIGMIVSNGHAGAGACAATGVKVGDLVISVADITDGGDVSAGFESVVTVNDQIQQSSSSDYSSDSLIFLVLHKS